MQVSVKRNPASKAKAEFQMCKDTKQKQTKPRHSNILFAICDLSLHKYFHKKSPTSSFLSDYLGGERGIRTPGPSQVNGFQDRRNRPLCHLSKWLQKYDIFRN